MKQIKPISQGIHAVESTTESWAIEPECFRKGDMLPHMHSQYIWVFLRDEEDTPMFFSVCFTPTGMSGCTLHRLGKTPYEKQRRLADPSIYNHRVSQECVYEARQGDPTWMSSDEITYEIGTEKPDFRVRLNSRGIYIIGADMDVYVKYLPFGAFFGEGCPFGAPYLAHFAEACGTYQGRPVIGMGGTEKIMGYPDTAAEYQSQIVLDLAGRRPDGRCESAIIYLYSQGRAMAFYHLEGEAPVTAGEVEFQGRFEPLPYTEDGTLLLMEAVCRFGGKELHYQAKYGFRGGGDPLDEKEGFSNTGGSWYEGSAFYLHREEFATTELHMITSKVLETFEWKEMG